MMNLETHNPFETSIIPGWAKKTGFQKCFIYRGNSMLPTFRPGQLLYVQETIENIQPGDVIIFRKSLESDFTVHRVVKQLGSGWLTRGDNNSRRDVLPVTLDQIIGRVEMVESNQRIWPVKSGFPVLWKVRLRWGLRVLKKWIPGFMKTIYHNIRQSKIVYRILNKYLDKHLFTIRLNTPTGTIIKTTYKGKTVARWFKGKKEMYCQKPFDLIIKREEVMKIKNAAKNIGDRSQESEVGKF